MVRVMRMYNILVYGRYGMASKGEGMSCEVVEVVKRSTLRWFGHLERVDEKAIQE